jgi:hypothetical protein
LKKVRFETLQNKNATGQSHMRKFSILLFSFISCQNSFAQTNPTLLPALFSNRSVKEGNSFLFNGREHIPYSGTIEGSPYYLSNDWQQGMLVFQETGYSNVFLKYDLIKDELIVRHHNGFLGVVLFTPRVQAFMMGDKVFENLQFENSVPMISGFYEMIAKGKLSLYVKRSKLLKETIIATTLEKKFIDTDLYYIVKDGVFYPIRKKNELMELMKEKKEVVNTHLKNEDIKFKSNPELTISSAVNFYNSLNY